MKTLVLFLLAAFITVAGYTQWNKDTAVRNIVCQSKNAIGELACSDGHKGVIVAWMDQRNAEERVYMQHIDSNGVAKWTANGKLLSSPGDQGAFSPVVVTDGHGGAVIFFSISLIGGTVNIYAQRIDGNGNELWGAGGVPVSTALDSRMRNYEDPASNQASPDGEGGAYVTWQTYGTFGISAQHIDKNGKPVWGANGLFVTSKDSTNISYGSNIVSTGNGTAAVAWGYGPRLFMQRVSATGTFLWGNVGLQVADSFDSRASSNASNILYDSTATTKNVTVAWCDARNPATSHDIYAQKIDMNGNFLWKNKGLPVETSPQDDVTPSMLIDGHGGFYIIFDSSSIACLQHVDKNGALLWGKGVRPRDGYLGLNPVIADDGSGGVIAMWNVLGKLYAQKYNTNGVSQWRAGGTPVISSHLDSMQVSSNHSVNPIISLRDGTAIAVWISQIGNVYAAKFGGSDGLLPVTISTFTVACQKQFALLQWSTANEINTRNFEVQTSSDGINWAAITIVPATGQTDAHNYNYLATNKLPGMQLYRLVEYDKDGHKTYSKIVAATCSEDYNNISMYPNPMTNTLHIDVSVTAATNAYFTIYNAAGKNIFNRQYYLPAGKTALAVDVHTLTPGMYIATIRDKNNRLLKSFNLVKAVQ